jgi:YidC/Oxa1 family membrane protein insertase
MGAIMDPIKEILGQVLMMIYNATGNYGIAIIGVTVVIKIVLLPLTLKQDKSMKDMKKIQPKIDALREKYKSNPEELNKQTMELYKEHKVNPFGSCLPLVVQMPILFGLFGVLRQVPEAVTNVNFLMWDLTVPDPIYILPILNGAVTFFQQKVMSPGATNPQMKSMTYTMPLMIMFISFRMPAGLQLYWLVSSGISALQQFLLINRGDDSSAK